MSAAPEPTNSPPNPQPAVPSQSPSSPPPPMPSGGGDTSYLDWPFAKMFTQGGAPPPTKAQLIQMINQTIKNMLTTEIERSNRIHKETMQKMKEALEDQ
jgi:hypothetical protein